MFDRESLAAAVAEISRLMTDNRGRLIELDQVNGDGDLGISMDDGFRALAAFLEASHEDDLGQLLRGSAKVLNQSAPSSLGTILSFGLMGMAKALRGQQEVPFGETVAALRAGVDNIMAKAESKPGEKTILDALVPGVESLERAVGTDAASGGGEVSDDQADQALAAAADAAAEGSEATRAMRAVHGRAAYTAARSIGVLDGGSVVGRLIFEGIAASRGA